MTENSLMRLGIIHPDHRWADTGMGLYSIAIGTRVDWLLVFKYLTDYVFVANQMIGMFWIFCVVFLANYYNVL